MIWLPAGAVWHVSGDAPAVWGAILCAVSTDEGRSLAVDADRQRLRECPSLAGPLTYQC